MTGGREEVARYQLPVAGRVQPVTILSATFSQITKNAATEETVRYRRA